MEEIRQERWALQQLAGRATGQDSRQRRLSTSAVRMLTGASDLLAMPHLGENGIPPLAMQVLNVASADFGKRYFITDYDRAGDGHPLR